MDLIKNYKMIIKRKFESDSENECQPLVSSSSSSSSLQSSGAIREPFMFKTDSDTEDFARKTIQNQTPSIPPLLLQKKLNRKMLFPSTYESPDLDTLEHIFGADDKFQSQKLDDSFISIEDLGDEGDSSNHSLVTIFAIWNTTVGTSLLSMPWGIEKTGLFPSILINILVAALCLYTAYTYLKINEKHGLNNIQNNYEVCDLCRELIGPWAEILAKIFSLIVLIGADIVYWVLMSNFLYNSVHLIYGVVISTQEQNPIFNQSVICPKDLIVLNETVPLTNFDKLWDLYSTVPIFLALIMFPLLNWKSPTFFTKFNSIGTLSILYLIIFIATKAFNFGINIKDWYLEFNLKSTFCALSGMLSLSYFIHNIIISLMRNNKHQHHNGRDLSIAFVLITFTYLFTGIVFYIAFPLANYCLEDNLLNNFNKMDILTIIARLLLLFQLFTVFPLITYMLRNDIFSTLSTIFKDKQFQIFTYSKVILLNIGILVVCVLFACFLPRIGTLIRYTGALSGMVYVFMLPSLLKIASLRKEGNLTVFQWLFHVFIIVIGCLNLISQFFISDN